MIFTKFLVGKKYSQKDCLKYENKDGANIGSSNYIFLLHQRIPEFLNSIIVLDGDVKKDEKLMREIKKYKNIVILPTDEYPEKRVYDCLSHLEDKDSFWDQTPGGYSKQACFMDFTDKSLSKAEIKKWFKDLKDKHGKRYQRFIAKSYEDMQEEIDEFINHFSLAYEYVLSKKM